MLGIPVEVDLEVVGQEQRVRYQDTVPRDTGHDLPPQLS
jgi:hypothetical protein